MKRETYEQKIGDILKLDQFEKLQYPRSNSIDWTRAEQNRINASLKEMLAKGLISEELHNHMKSSGGQPERLYGLAKVHKTVIPLRSVLSMPGLRITMLLQRLLSGYQLFRSLNPNARPKRLLTS